MICCSQRFDSCCVIILTNHVAINIETFAEELTLKEVKLLKKAKLIQVAQHYKLEVNSTLEKSELKKLVMEYRDSLRR